MWRFLGYAVQVALLIAAAVWLVNNPGQVTVEWLGWRIDSTVAVALLLVALSVGVLVQLDRLLRAVWGAPRGWRRWRAARRTRRAEAYLTQGFAAVAAGDGAKAGQLADRAQAMAGPETLPLLLRAQAAEAAGEDAEPLWRKLIDDADGDADRLLLGLHGLAEGARRRGDYSTALTLVGRAQTVFAQSPWALRARHDLDIRTGNWTDAEASLKGLARAHLMSGEALRRRGTLVALGRALAAAREGLPDDAAAHARRAWKADPDFLPAAIISARMDLSIGKASRAAQTVESAWAACAHPHLAACYAAAAPRADALTQVKRFQLLLELAPNAAESHLALADAALAARLWGQARQHYEQADRLDPAAHRRAYRGLAAVAASEPPLETARLVDSNQPLAVLSAPEESGAAESTALALALEPSSMAASTLAPTLQPQRRDWARLAQQLSDPAYAPDWGWHCDNCGTPAKEWTPTCTACGTIDTLDWRMPKAAVEPASAKTIPVKAHLLLR
jgi:HemY protein